MKRFSQILVLLFCSYLSAQTGIGTTTPVNKLQVETTTADPATTGVAANGNLRLSGVTGSHVLDFGLSSSSTYSWLQSRSRFQYGTNYDLVLNPNGGNIGVGTTTPLAKFHVKNGYFRLEYSSTPYFEFFHSGAITNQKIVRIGVSDGNMVFDKVNDAYTTSTEFMRINSSGNLGLGTATPTAKLHVNGDIVANSIAGTSDARFKTNISPIIKPLDKVLQLKGVTFDWNTKEFPSRAFSKKRAVGFIAQEVEKIVPEVVETEITEEGYKSVQYDKIVALLVEAIKEQQQQIEELQQQVKVLTEKKANEK
jgi:uncharacterized coiled-coil protein SlyX